MVLVAGETAVDFWPFEVLTGITGAHDASAWMDLTFIVIKYRKAFLSVYRALSLFASPSCDFLAVGRPHNLFEKGH